MKLIAIYKGSENEEFPIFRPQLFIKIGPWEVFSHFGILEHLKKIQKDSKSIHA